MATYLITGGAGFTGSNIAAELVQRGEQAVKGVDYALQRRLRKAA